jgi:hypothetical protein
MDMDITDIKFGEGTDIDDDGRIFRFKRAKFKVNGMEHTIKISMVDFENGKSRAIIEKEAAKIMAVYSGK